MNLFPRMRAWRAALAPASPVMLLRTLSAAALAGVDAEALKKLASDDFDEKGAAIEAIAANPDARTLPVLKALADGQLFVDGQGGGWIRTDTEVIDALTGKPAKLPDPAPDEVPINDMLRGQIDAALAALKLFAPERDVRLAAARSLFAFRSRIKGVYFSIITQALTFAFMLLFFRNETGFGGNNGFTDFKTILGFRITDPSTKASLLAATAVTLFGTFVLARWLVTCTFGRVQQAIRDAESRARSTCRRSASSTRARCRR